MFWSIVGAILFVFIGIPLIIYLLSKRWFWGLFFALITLLMILTATIVLNDQAPEWLYYLMIILIISFGYFTFSTFKGYFDEPLH